MSVQYFLLQRPPAHPTGSDQNERFSLEGRQFHHFFVQTELRLVELSVASGLVEILLLLLGSEGAAEPDLGGVVRVLVNVGLPPLLQLQGGDDPGGSRTLCQPRLVKNNFNILFPNGKLQTHRPATNWGRLG